MFLSQLRVNTSRASTIHLLNSMERLHACIATSTPGSSRPLWRLDSTSRGHIVYVTSDTRPDFTGFREQYGYPALPESVTFRIENYDRMLDSLQQGGKWYFETVVSPTLKKNGNIIPLTTRDDDSDKSRLTASEWLKRRMGDGAVMDSLRKSSEGTTVIMKKGHRVKFKWVRYQGVLTVGDVDLLHSLLTNGIGREKAYGCGLLTLAPHS